jgi:exonuclease I
MDRITYCSALDQRMKTLQERLSARAFPAPSTLAAAERQSELRARRDHLLAQTDHLRARLQVLLQNDESNWESIERELDREEREIESLATSL